MSSQLSSTGKKTILYCCLLITVLLVVRDVRGISINKYVFLIIALFPIMVAPIENLVLFMGFIIPLYVGLPGNLISALLLIRLIYSAICKQYTIDRIGFLLTILLSVFILIQDIITAFIGLYNILAAVDFLTIFLIMSIALQKNVVRDLIIYFAVGVFVTGFVMLCATLNYYSFEDLMNPATRLGYTGMLIKASGSNMGVSVDPNFYGMNVIAAISSGVIVYREMQGKTKIVITIALVGSFICGLIGISRAFIVVAVLWAVLWSLSQGKIKQAILTTTVLVLFTTALYFLFPDVVNGILLRFSAGDIAGANGRLYLIQKYFEPWQSSVINMFFGIGLFNCHTHSGPIMYFFGLGFVGTLLLVLWFGRLYTICRERKPLLFRCFLSFLCTFICFSTIPAAGALNYTFPLIISISVMSIMQGERNKKCIDY